MAKIGYDLRVVANAQKSGVENYILNLARSLPPKAPEFDFYFFVDSRATSQHLNDYKHTNVKVVHIPVQTERTFWRVVSIYARFKQLDLFHFPISIIPKGFVCKKIVTVHDLTYETNPNFYEQWEVDLQKKEVRRSTEQADSILAVSHATKSDIINFYNISSKKVSVVYPGLRSNMSKPSPTKQPQFRYFLALGNIQPRKNFANAIKAVAKLEDTSVKLIIAGKIQYETEYKKLTSLIEELGLEKRVKFEHYVSDQKLANLFGHAVGLVYPSIREGYGYPIAEAFYYGIPVITSNMSAMAEVAQDAALLVSPSDCHQIAKAMTTLLQDKKSVKKLIESGHKRLEALKKESDVNKVVKLYHSVLAESIKS